VILIISSFGAPVLVCAWAAKWPDNGFAFASVCAIYRSQFKLPFSTNERELQEPNLCTNEKSLTAIRVHFYQFTILVIGVHFYRTI
jgi:hypothetical protein